MQTAGCAPLARAWRAAWRRRALPRRRAKVALHVAVGDDPASLAHGILDDETYDWWEIAEACGPAAARSWSPRGRCRPGVTPSRVNTAISVSATGSAGLAGALLAARPGESLAVVFSGAERRARE